MPAGYSFATSVSTRGKSLTALTVVLAGLLSTAIACNRTTPPPAEPEPSLFQKLTGDDPEDDRSRWDQLFSTQDYVFGKNPAAFLQQKIGEIPAGRALDIAMGEGRNAVFLAKKGFIVEGIDISEVATHKARLLARENGVEIQTRITDLQRYAIPPGQYHLIVNIQYLQRSLIPGIQAGLRKGGYVVFENPTTDELKRLPKQGLRRDYLLEPGELRRLFSDLEIVHYSEGPGENGQIVARLLARKP